MTKKEFITALAAKQDISKKDAESVLDSVIGIITEQLANGNEVSISGFGSFEVRERCERQGRNPRTNESVVIPASRVPAFKAGKALKNSVAK